MVLLYGRYILYVIDGTIGQADAGVLSGGRFAVAGGYWVEVLPRARILLPLINADR